MFLTLKFPSFLCGRFIIIFKTYSGMCFRCRVDFTTSQTRTERIHLRVIVRPSVPQILDNTGAVLDLYAGPYRWG